MGGIMIVLPVLILCFALNVARVVQTGEGASIFLPLLLMFGFAILGMIDDWSGIQKSRGLEGEGISARAKLAGQFVLAGAGAAVISFGNFSYANEFIIPLLNISRRSRRSSRVRCK